METKLTNKKLAIISGGGDLPAKVINECIAKEKDFFVVTFAEQDKPSNFTDLAESQTKEFGLGSIGSIIKELKSQNIEEIVFAGYIKKPSLFNLDLDLTGVKILAKVAANHDDQVLNAIANELTSKGFTMLGAHEICPNLLIADEVLSNYKLAEKLSEDIILGMQTAQEIGKLDIGQAVIVKDKVILGVEAIEGTDNLIERCAGLRGKSNKGGLLVKISKPQQNLNLDMPSIGIKTIENLIKYNYDGLVVSANSTIFLDKEKALELAEKHNLLLAGVDVNEFDKN